VGQSGTEWLGELPTEERRPLKRTARRLFSAEYSPVLLESFNEKDPIKTNWNPAQISGFIGGSKLEFLCSFSF